MAGEFYYAPGVQNRAGELMAQGIEHAGDALASGFERLGRVRDAAKGADAFYKALGPQAQTITGIPEDQWNKMGWGQKIRSMTAAQQTMPYRQAAQNVAILEKMLGGTPDTAPAATPAPQSEPAPQPRPANWPVAVPKPGVPAASPAQPQPQQASGSPLDRMIADPQALAAVMANPVLSRAFTSAMKLRQMTAAPTLENVGGVNVIRDGNTFRVVPRSAMNITPGEQPSTSPGEGRQWVLQGNQWRSMPLPPKSSKVSPAVAARVKDLQSQQAELRRMADAIDGPNASATAKEQAQAYRQQAGQIGDQVQEVLGGTPAPTDTGLVQRLTKDGRVALFNPTTKAFVKYAQ